MPSIPKNISPSIKPFFMIFPAFNLFFISKRRACFYSSLSLLIRFCIVQIRFEAFLSLPDMLICFTLRSTSALAEAGNSCSPIARSSHSPHLDVSIIGFSLAVSVEYFMVFIILRRFLFVFRRFIHVHIHIDTQLDTLHIIV